CIECPNGCLVTVITEDGRVKDIKGNKCPKAFDYVKQEIEHPLRIFTTTIKANKLSLAVVPVRTDKPIPKSKLFEAIEAVREIRITKPVLASDVLINDFLGLGVNLIVTRSVTAKEAK
ncbi:MAG: DUF1667 domain-containing protein, partial [Candidatus Omnitrophica bacterium]|nr:DUF1667 domain-containing protein [Candidatus Omnitrophota bacterium]